MVWLCAEYLQRQEKKKKRRRLPQVRKSRLRLWVLDRASRFEFGRALTAAGSDSAGCLLVQANT